MFESKFINFSALRLNWNLAFFISPSPKECNSHSWVCLRIWVQGTQTGFYCTDEFIDRKKIFPGGIMSLITVLNRSRYFEESEVPVSRGLPLSYTDFSLDILSDQKLIKACINYDSTVTESLRHAVRVANLVWATFIHLQLALGGVANPWHTYHSMLFVSFAVLKAHHQWSKGCLRWDTE